MLGVIVVVIGFLLSFSPWALVTQMVASSHWGPLNTTQVPKLTPEISLRSSSAVSSNLYKGQG